LVAEHYFPRATFDSLWLPLHVWAVCVVGRAPIWRQWPFPPFSLHTPRFPCLSWTFLINPSIYFSFRFDLCYFDYYLFYFEWFMKLTIFFNFIPLYFFSIVKFSPHYFDCYFFYLGWFLKLDFLRFHPLSFFFHIEFNLYSSDCFIFAWENFLNWFFLFHTSALNLLGIELLNWSRVQIHELRFLEINSGLENSPKFAWVFFFFFLNSCFFRFYPLTFIQLKIGLYYFCLLAFYRVFH
jgi:hypothetical protein